MRCRRLGGPPRARPRQLSAAGHKAGSKVGSAPWQFPADRLRRAESWSPWELLSLSCPAGHRIFEAGGVGRLVDMKKQGAGFWPPVSLVLGFGWVGVGASLSLLGYGRRSFYVLRYFRELPQADVHADFKGPVPGEAVILQGDAAPVLFLVNALLREIK